MITYKCHILGDTERFYISKQDCTAILTDDYLKMKNCENYADIPEGTNHLAITCKDDVLRIVQASGYSEERGLFCDSF